MIIIKIGGGRDINIAGIAKGVSQLCRGNRKCIIIHGANHCRDELLRKLEKEKKNLLSVSGYSSVYSDREMIESIMMAYSGLRNKSVVEALQIEGVNAIGLSGIDGRLVTGKRNLGIKIKEGEKIKIIRDYSGKPASINKELLSYLTQKGYCPVISIPIIDESGYAINTENDEVVALMKNELGIKEVIQLIEAPGILKDKNDEESLIQNINGNELEEMEKKADARMKRKLLAIKKLLPCKVMIADGRAEDPITEALTGKGTIIS